MATTPLIAPRRVDKTVLRVTRAYFHARGARPSKRRRKALVQLRRIRLELEILQTRTVNGTMPPLSSVKRMMKRIDHALKDFMGKKPRRRQLRQLQRTLKKRRRQLRAL